MLGFEVRQTPYDSGRLILHRDDADDARFALVTGQLGEYSIRGWILGSEGKDDEWWGDPQGGRPAYFVPQSALGEVKSLDRFV